MSWLGNLIFFFCITWIVKCLDTFLKSFKILQFSTTIVLLSKLHHGKFEFRVRKNRWKFLGFFGAIITFTWTRFPAILACTGRSVKIVQMVKKVRKTERDWRERENTFSFGQRHHLQTSSFFFYGPDTVAMPKTQPRRTQTDAKSMLGKFFDIIY